MKPGKAVWEIPPDRMKMKRPHLAPLSTQVLEALQGMVSATR